MCCCLYPHGSAPCVWIGLTDEWRAPAQSKPAEAGGTEREDIAVTPGRTAHAARRNTRDTCVCKVKTTVQHQCNIPACITAR